jgi:hypothetical protein
MMFLRCVEGKAKETRIIRKIRKNVKRLEAKLTKDRVASMV